jgi:NAD(P)-dependent dehydrogenase (short-subunit alcohol dehydrogenase family)
MSLTGKGILITGGSMGIGKSVALACLQAGADVVICGRDERALASAREELKSGSSTDAKIFAKAADVADSRSVVELFKETVNVLPNFTGLVSCAAITGPTGFLDENDVNEWIATINVNLIGTMLTCRAAIPHFRRTGFGRIVNFSGGGATAPRPRFTAYGAAKAAVVRLTETIAEELSGTNITANAVAPGAVNTRMLEDVLSAGPEAVGEEDYARALKQKSQGGTPPEKAAELCTMLLSDEAQGITGRLISAVWDPWRDLGQRKTELQDSDVYTLRRIVPSDRGLNWD